MKGSNSIDGVKARILVDAICELVKAGVPYSFYVSKILWGVSLYLQSGSFVERWQSYPRVSDAARKIRDTRSKDWRKQVTFEHVQPLNQVYALLLKEGQLIAPAKAVQIIGTYPPILITREEDAGLTKNGHKSSGDPEERYRNVRFSNFTLETSPTYALP
jgi:hypothetical protein